MNLLLDPNLWYGGGYNPPIYWNPSEQRYEILIDSQFGENGILLELNVDAVQGDTIDFDYEIDGFIDANTTPDFVGIQSDLGDFIWTLPVEDLPATGSVSVECEAGRRYSIGLYRDFGYGFSLYAFEAIITPTPDPQELTANDDEATTPMNTPVTVPVLANDTLGDEPVALEDLAGPPTIVTQPPVGTATVNPDGTITYTPPEGFTGEVEFQYMIETPNIECYEIHSNDGYFNDPSALEIIPGFEWGNYPMEFMLSDGNIERMYEYDYNLGSFKQVSDNEYPECGSNGPQTLAWPESEWGGEVVEVCISDWINNCHD